MKRILITGARGFSARYLINYLQEELSVSAEIFGVVRTPDQRPHAEHRKLCDLTDYNAVSSLLADVQPTWIFHLSGSFTNHFDADCAGNVWATRNLLDAARGLDKRDCKILVVGSAAEYGYVSKEGESVAEGCPSRPVSVYGLTKAFQTSLAQYYARVHGLHIIIVRPFNLIGRGMSNRLFVGRLYEQILAMQRGGVKEIRLGDISGARDYVDIHDAVRAYRIALEHGGAGEIYNVGSGRLTPIQHLVELFLTRFKVDPRTVRSHTGQHRPSDASPSFCADATKLQHLGWSPVVDIEASVRRFI